jgi:hypothetical protein
VLDGGTLWHLQKFFQYIKHIILEFTPPPFSFIFPSPEYLGNSEKLPKHQGPNEEMANELNTTFSKEKIKKNEEMLTMPDHKGNADQNYIKIPPHSCYNGYHKEFQQQ